MKQMFAGAILSLLLFACKNEKTEETKTMEVKSDTASTATSRGPAEFADPKYADIGRNGFQSLASGDVDSWINGFADNAVYQWNTGDSLTGKEAISKYWKNRRSQVIDSLTFSDGILLPLKVNQPQSIEQPGVWLLCWYKVHSKYKSGGSMTQWMHIDMHFDSNDKIDRVIQYMDRAMVAKAEKKS